MVVSSRKGKELNDLLDIEILSNLRLMSRDTPTTSEKVNHEQTNQHTRTCVYNYVIYMYIYINVYIYIYTYVCVGSSLRDAVCST